MTKKVVLDLDDLKPTTRFVVRSGDGVTAVIDTNHHLISETGISSFKVVTTVPAEMADQIGPLVDMMNYLDRELDRRMWSMVEMYDRLEALIKEGD